MNRIRYLRELHHLNKTELAEKIGANRTTILRYENGERKVGLEAAMRLSEFFGVSIAYLMGEDEPDQVIDDALKAIESVYNPAEIKEDNSARMIASLVGICRGLNEDEISKIIDYAKLISASHDFRGGDDK